MPAAFDRPYKGPESFQPEDGDLFFGRERETDAVVAQILSARMMLLHAPSGAGKTSLLNARIVPELEARGWLPVRVLPQDNPIAAVKHATLRWVLPPPAAEAEALRRAVERLAPGDPDVRLGDLLERYDALARGGVDRRRLVSPVAAPDTGEPSGWLAGGTFVPYSVRLLRSSLTVEAFAAHVAVAAGPPANGAVTEDSVVAALVAHLAGADAAESHRTLAAAADTPVAGLVPFFQNLTEVYGQRVGRFAVVLILDQFEEVFTRFVDPGPAARSDEEVPDWRLRWKLFEELEQLYRTEVPGAAGQPPSVLPIRWVISMRDEYIAQLDAIRRFTRELDDAAYHLGFLGLAEARTAIEEPAARFGYAYAPGCLERILGDLCREDRFVEPIHVQIVCDKFWDEAGRRLARADAGPDALPSVELAAFEQLGGAAGILETFLSEFLDQLPPGDRLEALDLLEPLITSVGTRNIVEHRALVEAPFRDAERRRRLLARFEARGIVRLERRLGGLFAEITHEFLIPVVRKEIGRVYAEDPGYARFRDGLRTLRRFEHVDVGGDPSAVLMASEFESLHSHRDDVAWPPWGTELMYRSALCHTDRDDALREWADRLASCNAADTTEAIAREYLGSSDERVRERACAALRVLGSDASVRELVRVALTHADPGLRDRAAVELRRVAPDALVHVGAELDRFLDVDASRSSAALLAGRLRADGVMVPLAPVAFRRRVARAMALGGLRDGQLGGLPRWPLTARALAGTLIASTGLAAALWLVFRETGLASGEAFGAILVLGAMAAGAGLVAVRGSSPIHLHVDRAAGTTANVVRVARSVVWMTLAVLLYGLATGGHQQGPVKWNPFVYVGLGTVLIVGWITSIRLGTLAAAGTLASPRGERLLRAVAGAVLGTIFITVAAVAIGFYEQTGDTDWALYVMMAGGMAAVLARVDDGVRPAPSAWRRRIVLACLAAIAVGTAVLIASAREPASVAGAGLFVEPGRKMAIASEKDSVPDPLNFRLVEGRRIVAQVPNDAPETSDYRIEVWNADGRLMAAANDLAYIDEELAPGDYCVVALAAKQRAAGCRPRTTLTARNSLPLLLARFPRFTRDRLSGMKQVPPFAVLLTIDGGPSLDPPPDAPPEMLEVPGGVYWSDWNGAVVRWLGDRPLIGQLAHTTDLLVDRTEVTVADFQRCADAGACTPPGGDGACNGLRRDRAAHPVNCVSWQQAQDFCTWAGKRLPIWAEWEKAARGVDGRIYPWGNEVPAGGRPANVADSTVPEGKQTAPAGSFPLDRSPYGVVDMLGNVSEWLGGPPTNPKEPNIGMVAGGAFDMDGDFTRVYSRGFVPRTTAAPRNGIRCVRDAGCSRVRTVFRDFWLVEAQCLGADGRPANFWGGWARMAIDGSGSIKYEDAHGQPVTMLPTVAWVDPFSRGVDAGLRVGDILLTVDGDRGEGPVALLLERRDRRRELLVARDGRTERVVVPPGVLGATFEWQAAPRDAVFDASGG